MILPRLEAGFQPLSLKHATLSARAQAIIRRYLEGTLEHPSYAVIGTFGAGKTQFLFSLFGEALQQRMLPLYFLAEDLFAEVIKSDVSFTQGDLDKLVVGKIERVSTLLSGGRVLEDSEESELRGLLGTGETSTELLGTIRTVLKQQALTTPKPVLFIDELEVLYRELQRRVQSEGDRSPLRELLGRRSFLKFVSLAPAGIYEMGNADQTRVIRLIIPAADVRYIREHLVKHEGRANAAWWLSRGKARHLFKACEVLRDLPIQLTPTEAGRVIRDELDHVGQHPTQVPAAVTDELQPSKVPYLLNLAPIKSQEAIRCYHVDTSAASDLPDKVAESFGISKDSASLFAEYFESTTRALSAIDGVAYVPSGDLPDLFALALDHLLEYEHGNPALIERMGELLSLYERFKSDPGALYGGVATVWNLHPLSFTFRSGLMRFVAHFRSP